MTKRLLQAFGVLLVLAGIAASQTKSVGTITLNGNSATFFNGAGGFTTPAGTGVSTTGSPANGNLTKFSGASSITNGNLSGDVTTTDTLATTIANNAVTEAKINNGAVTEAKITLADNTTNDCSTTKHGFTPKAPNVTTKYLDGTCNWSTPSGTGGGVSIPTLVQGAAAVNTSTSLTTTLGSTPTVGNILYGIVAGRTRGANSITQTNVVWTQLVTYNGNSQYIEIWKGVISASAATGATAAFTGSANNYLQVVEVAHTLGTAGSSVNGTGTGASFAIGPLTASAGSFVIAAVSSNSPAGGMLLSGIPNQALDGAGAAGKALMLFSPGGQLTFTGINTTAVAWAGVALIIS